MMKKLIFKSIAIGSDHAAFEMKTKVIDYLKTSFKEVEIVDCGCYTTERVDYPDIAHEVCKKVQKKETDGGIVICGTGIGISIAANKHEGIICGLASSEYTATMIRQHNNSNVLAFGGRNNEFEDAKKYVDAFLVTPFEGGRHEERVKKLVLHKINEDDL